MIEIKLFRMATGEEVVAELVSEDETTVTIKNGLVVFPNQNQTVGFAPWDFWFLISLIQNSMLIVNILCILQMLILE